MRTSRLSVLLIAIGLVAAACSSGQQAEESGTPTTVALEAVPTNYIGYLRQPTACNADQPEPATNMKFDAPQDVGALDQVTVTLETSCGPIEIGLDPSTAPETVNSFIFLAESGYFDGTVSHRIVPGFMMQAGDPTATGLGGPGYSVPDEYPDTPAYERGTVAMANAGPGTTGSQFFILFGGAEWLPPTFTIFGTVVDGFDTLDRIEQIPLGRGPNGTDPSPSTPLESLYIESVTVTR